jgi:hypothetical protein
MNPHKHLLIRAKIDNNITDTDAISNWISDLVEKIQMKILHGPVSVYCDKIGNKGVTAFAIIETSHIVLHIWNETNPLTLQLDVYTCSELEINLVFNALNFFRPILMDYKFLDREEGFLEINNSPVKIVEKWIARISKKYEEIGGNKICPFATMPIVITVEKLCSTQFVNLNDKVTVYMENGIHSSYNEIEELCKSLKKANPNFVFLPDHPHKPNYINGQETGNGIFPCIIVQTTQELNLSRVALEKTDYYSYWDKYYLDEIRSFN